MNAVGPARATRLPLLVVLLVTATVVVLGAGLLLVAHVALPGPPSEHHKPSFHYGEKVLDSIYGTAYGSIDEACAAAIRSRDDHPRPFKFGEALAGCRYQEFMYDN